MKINNTEHKNITHFYFKNINPWGSIEEGDYTTLVHLNFKQYNEESKEIRNFKEQTTIVKFLNEHVTPIGYENFLKAKNKNITLFTQLLKDSLEPMEFLKIANYFRFSAFELGQGSGLPPEVRKQILEYAVPTDGEPNTQLYKSIDKFNSYKLEALASTISYLNMEHLLLEYAINRQGILEKQYNHCYDYFYISHFSGPRSHLYSQNSQMNNLAWRGSPDEWESNVFTRPKELTKCILFLSNINQQLSKITEDKYILNRLKQCSNELEILFNETQKMQGEVDRVLCKIFLANKPNLFSEGSGTNLVEFVADQYSLNFENLYNALRFNFAKLFTMPNETSGENQSQTEHESLKLIQGDMNFRKKAERDLENKTEYLDDYVILLRQHLYSSILSKCFSQPELKRKNIT